MSEKKIEKKGNHDEWLKGLAAKKFREVFAEWYLPAIRSKFTTLEDRIKKLEEWRMIYDDTLTEGGG